MTKPSDPTVAELVDLLDDNLAEMFQERASVRELEAGLTRNYAEALALLDVVNRYPEALSGVTVFAFDINDSTHFVVATDHALAREHVASSGADTYRTTNVARVVRERFDGISKLTSAA